MGPVRYRARYIGYSAALAVVGFLLLAAPMAAAALAAEPLAPEPLVPEPSLTVSPSHGRPTAPLAATFRIANAVRCPSTATFYWDGQQIRETGFRDRCVATAAFTPPPGDRAPGPHTVTAVAGHFSDSTTYVVDPVPSPTFSPKPTPSPTTVAPTTAAPTPGRTRSTPTPEASVAAPLPVPDGPDESSPAAAAAGPAKEPPVVRSSSAQGLVSGGALLAGAVLVLLGAAAMVLLFLRSRQEAADSDTPTVEFPRFSD